MDARYFPSYFFGSFGRGFDNEYDFLSACDFPFPPIHSVDGKNIGTPDHSLFQKMPGDFLRRSC